MIKTIKINNRDTRYTIDTYATFTGESFIESECEHLGGEYDDFEWDYDTDGIRDGLAKRSIEIIKDLTGDEIIKDIIFVTTGHPQFYNYTTDHYTMEIKYDEKKLDDWIASREEAFTEYKKEMYNPDDLELYRITFYLDSFYDESDGCTTDYIGEMAESEWEIYSENVKITKKQGATSPVEADEN